MTRHYEKFRAYVHAVRADSLTAEAFLAGLQADAEAIGRELGVMVATRATNAVHEGIDRLIGAGIRKVGQLLDPPKRRR